MIDAAVGGGVLVVLLGYPVLLSTVCRVPVLVVGEDGLRFPLLGPRVAWADIARVKRSVGGRARQATVPALRRTYR